MYKTFKEAMEKGWIAEKHFRGANYINPDSPYILVRNKKLYRPLTAKCKSEWRKRGYKVKDDAVGWWIKNGYASYQVYKQGDCVPFKRRKTKPPVALELTMENVLLSIFTLNRSAKRQRDLASNYYNYKMHGFAQSAKCKKMEYYNLKDDGIAFAFINGWIQPVSINGGLVLYRGNGYCFHSTMKPQYIELDTNQDDEEYVYIEAKPREKIEPRVVDAIHTLRSIVVDKSGFEILKAPKTVYAKTYEYENDEDDDEYEYEDDDDDLEF